MIKRSQKINYAKHSWQRVSNPYALWRVPYIAYLPSLFQILFIPFPPRLQPPPTLLFLFPCVYGWMGHRATFYASFYLIIMDLHISSLDNLVPEGDRLWCVFYATRHQVYWGLTHVIFASTLIWYHTPTHKQRHTAHSGQ